MESLAVSRPRILVTGSRGYVGMRLAPALATAGHQVVGLDTDLYRRCLFGTAPEETQDRVVSRDIRDVTLDDLEGFDAVVHLAGLSNDPLGDLDPALTVAINEAATLRLASLARRAGVRRFIFASSCSVYGASGDAVVDERSTPRPLTPYARSKAAAEEGLLALASREFSPVLLRYATAYGPSPRLRFDLLVNNLAAWVVATGCIRLKSDGAAWRPLVHVEDMCQAVVSVLDAPRAVVHGEIYNVGSTEENHRVRDVAAQLAAVWTGARVERAAGAGRDPRSYRVSCEKLARTFPGTIRWRLADGLRDLLDAYVAVGIRIEQVEGPAFQRVAHLRDLTARGILTPDLRPVRPTPAGTDQKVCSSTAAVSA